MREGGQKVASWSKRTDLQSACNSRQKRQSCFRENNHSHQAGRKADGQLLACADPVGSEGGLPCRETHTEGWCLLWGVQMKRAEVPAVERCLKWGRENWKLGTDLCNNTQEWKELGKPPQRSVSRMWGPGFLQGIVWEWSEMAGSRARPRGRLLASKYISPWVWGVT